MEHVMVKLLIKVAIFVSFTEAANILVFLPCSAPSHVKPFLPLFYKLAQRGHNVTVISQFPTTKKIANYTDIELKNIKIKIASIGFANLRKQTRFQNWMYMHDELQKYTIEIARQPIMRNLIKSKHTKFDLVFVEHYHMDGFFALGHRFNCPIIGLSFQHLLPQYHWIKRNPLTYSYIPHVYLPYDDNMNFWQRLTNTLFGVFTMVFYQFSSISWHQEQAHTLLESNGNDAVPRTEDLLRYLSLIFVEAHFSAGYARPNLPNIIDLAGIHIEPVKKLPQDLHDFMNDAENGVIYVSLGTLIEPESARELEIKFINIFRRISYRVIWKWKATSGQNITNNVMVREWLPQMDILDHPKCKLFISHGGYHSLLETIYGGVPILGLPFFTDQHYNTALIEKLSIGKKANPETGEQDLENIIMQLLTDSKYTRKVRLQSQLFKDRPSSPMDTAIYWTEYVLRYKGAARLNSAATELYWFQYLLLDVIATLLVTLCGLLYVVAKCSTKCYKTVLKVGFVTQKCVNKFKKTK